MKIFKTSNFCKYEPIEKCEAIKIFIDEEKNKWIDVDLNEKEKSITIRGTERIAIRPEAGNCVKIKLDGF